MFFFFLAVFHFEVCPTVTGWTFYPRWLESLVLPDPYGVLPCLSAFSLLLNAEINTPKPRPGQVGVQVWCEASLSILFVTQKGIREGIKMNQKKRNRLIFSIQMFNYVTLQLNTTLGPTIFLAGLFSRHVQKQSISSLQPSWRNRMLSIWSWCSVGLSWPLSVASGFFRYKTDSCWTFNVITERVPEWELNFKVPSGKLTWQWKMSLLKMYSLLKMGIFHCYVSLLEGIFYGHPTKFGTGRTCLNFFFQGPTQQVRSCWWHDVHFEQWRMWESLSVEVCRSCLFGRLKHKCTKSQHDTRQRG